MEAQVIWKDRLSFSATADSGFRIDMGTDPAVGGDNDGFRPIELMAISLGGCTAMDVMSILQKKRQDVTGFEVKVHARRASEHPKVFTHIMVEYLVTGHNVDPVALERAIELSETAYCPAFAMLSKAATIEHRYQIFEAG